MVARILGTSRYLILIAVIGSFVASATLIVYGALAVAGIVIDTIAHGAPDGKGAKELAVAMVEMIDVFLLGTVLYIVAAGLYTLFVGPLNLPSWLKFNSLDELKSQLVMVIIVLLAVTFLGQAVIGVGINILYIGIATALVVAALTYALARGHAQVPHAPPDSTKQSHHESK
jgi:uncharacterized membrane protein YqhA